MALENFTSEDSRWADLIESTVRRAFDEFADGKPVMIEDMDGNIAVWADVDAMDADLGLYSEFTDIFAIDPSQEYIIYDGYVAAGLMKQLGLDEDEITQVIDYGVMEWCDEHGKGDFYDELADECDKEIAADLYAAFHAVLGKKDFRIVPLNVNQFYPPIVPTPGTPLFLEQQLLELNSVEHPLAYELLGAMPVFYYDEEQNIYVGADSFDNPEAAHTAISSPGLLLQDITAAEFYRYLPMFKEIAYSSQITVEDLQAQEIEQAWAMYLAGVSVDDIFV